MENDLYKYVLIFLPSRDLCLSKIDKVPLPKCWLFYLLFMVLVRRWRRTGHRCYNRHNFKLYVLELVWRKSINGEQNAFLVKFGRRVLEGHMARPLVHLQSSIALLSLFFVSKIAMNGGKVQSKVKCVSDPTWRPSEPDDWPLRLPPCFLFEDVPLFFCKLAKQVFRYLW